MIGLSHPLFDHNTKYMQSIKYRLKLMWLHLKDFPNGDAILSSVCAPSTASTFKVSLCHSVAQQVATLEHLKYTHEVLTSEV